MMVPPETAAPIAPPADAEDLATGPWGGSGGAAALTAPTPPARLRAPAWADTAAAPQPGERCSTCWGRWWWSERDAPRRGWRCWCCIPAPAGLGVRECET